MFMQVKDPPSCVLLLKLMLFENTQLSLTERERDSFFNSGTHDEYICHQTLPSA